MSLRFILAAALAAGTAPQEAPTSLLERSDAMRERAIAAADGRMAVDALELASAAAGHVFRPGGAAADIGYDERRAEAIRLAKGDQVLLGRVDALPDVERGAVRGAGRDRQMLSASVWRDRIAFRGGEVAALYVRATQPVRLSVRVGNRSLCDARRDSGRVICQWLPGTTSDAVVTVSGAPGTRFELFTN